jgi:hypothetical protein
MTTATSDLLLPGYFVDPVTGAWCTLPWPTDPDARVELARTSLGPGVIAWGEEWLVNPVTGRPWRYTPGQKRFLVLWYAVTPDGRWRYRSGVKRGAKGTGKDPFGASLCLGELLGPTRIVDMDGDRPVGAPHFLPLVQVAANSEAQAKDVLRVGNAMLPRETRAAYGIDVGETRTNVDGGGRWEILTASEKSSEGDPATFVMLNESHHMTASSGGHAVAAVARRNVGKSPAEIQARLCEFTNAHRQGMDSTAEQSFLAWQQQAAGKAKRRDILYDSIEAPPASDLFNDASRMAALRAAYMDAPWSDLERLSDEILDPRTPVADSIRYYLNGLAAAEDAWVDPGKFDRLTRDVAVKRRDQVALFLDCSKSEDATGLVACRIDDGHVVTLGVWQRPHGDRGKGWLAPRAEVDAKVRETFRLYDVVWFGVDPSPAEDDETEALYWATVIDGWHRDFRSKVAVWATPGEKGSAVLFDMRLSQRGGKDRNKVFTEAAELTAREIDEDSDDPDAPALTHDGDPILRTHVHQARRRPNPWGVSLGKETRDSKKLVDLAVCMVGARMGRRLYLNSGKVRKKKTGRVVGQ